MLHCQFNGCDIQFKQRHQTEYESSCKEKEVNCCYCNQIIKHYNEKVSCDFFKCIKIYEIGLSFTC